MQKHCRCQVFPYASWSCNNDLDDEIHFGLFSALMICCDINAERDIVHINIISLWFCSIYYSMQLPADIFLVECGCNIFLMSGGDLLIHDRIWRCPTTFKTIGWMWVKAITWYVYMQIHYNMPLQGNRLNMHQNIQTSTSMNKCVTKYVNKYALSYA